MNRIYICQACINEKYGIKTRLQVAHTCGRENEKITLSAYEVGCDDFSQIIIADSLSAAIIEFERANSKKAIWAQNNHLIKQNK